MSHLTANPFSKHFEFPRTGPLLTPPDTESEYIRQPFQPLPAPAPAPLALGIDLGDPLPISSHRSIPSATTEVPAARKVSSVQYIHSGPREARERIVQRGVRWLVIVVPPVCVITENGHFGHTLSVGAPEKLAQGILMPLFPTMSGQLGAIAREFAFPSTAGLCLYIRTNIEGVAMTPRISDESWQMLWASYFEPRSPSTGMPAGQLPISGRIEFDIDLRKARWYETWLGLGRRDLVDVPVSVTPSRPQSVSHWRGDSRTTFLDDQPDDQLDSTSASLLTIARPSRLPGNRHIPRKLSLLDRLESASLRSGSKLVPRNVSPPSPGPLPQEAVVGLSPVMQEDDEPKTAHKDIAMLVNSWRASASLAAGSPLAATGQTSLDPANMPNDLPIAEDGEEPDSELNLDDFAWSVSSPGPLDEVSFDEDSSIESWRLPSVHLDRRLGGSVCLTPSTHTSWGPNWDSDEDDLSSISEISRLPTPDLAARMIEDCPPTPSTATSWGPPSYPASPLSEVSIILSIDIGHRGAGSVALTPATATTWGPPLEWPTSPATPYYVRTPDVGQRSFDLDAPRPWHHVWPYQRSTDGDDEAHENADVEPHDDVSSPSQLSGLLEPTESQLYQDTEKESTGPYPFVFPYYNASTNSEPWKLVWPYHATESCENVEEISIGPYPFVFPYYASSSSQACDSEPSKPWKLVWPYHTTEDVENNEKPSDSQSNSEPWQLVWPYHIPASSAKAPSDSYPLVFPYYKSSPESESEEPTTPSEPWRYVWPYSVAKFDESEPEQGPYPFVFPWYHPDSHEQGAEIHDEAHSWKQVWPYRHTEEVQDSDNAADTNEHAYSLASPYYDSAYATSETTTVSEVDTDKECKPWTHVWPYTDSSLQQSYPYFNIYPAVYPHHDLYPAPTGESVDAVVLKELPVQLEPTYPTVRPYAKGYPDVEPYPSLSVGAGLVLKDVSEEEVRTEAVESVKVAAAYPVIGIYPAVYPHSVDEIYGAAMKEEETLTPSMELSAVYPVVEPYRHVYPYNLKRIYPTLVAEDERTPTSPELIEIDTKAREDITLNLTSYYPNICLYAPVYPSNLDSIYPAVRAIALEDDRSDEDPSSYPHNLSHIYSSVSSSKVMDVRIFTRYPTLEIYPPVYPWTVDHLYPSSSAQQGSVIRDIKSMVVVLSVNYPCIRPYPAVYPYNLQDIYPPLEVSKEMIQPRSTKAVVAYARNSKPHMREHSHHAKHSSGPRLPPPPVPPLPQDMETLRPIHPASRRPLSGERVAMSLPVRLPTFYPAICPYPPVYPYLDLYHARLPTEAAEKHPVVLTRLEARYPAIEIYHPVYPYIEIYPQAAAVKICLPARPEAPAIALEAPKGFLPRRQPKRTHDDLHRLVFGPTAIEDETITQRPEIVIPEDHETVALKEEPVPTVQETAIAVIAPIPSPTLGASTQSPVLKVHRRLPSLPPQGPLPPIPSVPSADAQNTNLSNPVPMATPSPSPRSRARSGTVSARPPLPTPPPMLSSISPQASPTPSPTFRKLPSVPEDAPSSSPSPSTPPRRPPSMRVPIGLPSSPAAGRRMSIVQPSFNRSPSFTPLPPLPEPGVLAVPPVPAPSSSPVSPQRRPLPPQPLTPESSASPPAAELQRSNSGSARIALPPLSEGAADLSRRKTLPARPLPRARRDSVVGPPSGIVAGLTRAYNASALAKVDEQPGDPTSPPPRAPLPPLPKNRPVSKLDRSKYPFA